MHSIKKGIRGSLLGLVLLGSMSLAACASNKITPADATDLATFSAAIALCNAQPDPAGCKAKVKARFDAAESVKFADAGGYVAPPAPDADGGAS